MNNHLKCHALLASINPAERYPEAWSLHFFLSIVAKLAVQNSHCNRYTSQNRPNWKDSPTQLKQHG